MPRGVIIDPKIKAEVITKIRDEGMRVVDASRIYGFTPRLIYSWLGGRVKNIGVELPASPNGRNLILENNRLKKELDNAYCMLGKATAMMPRGKG